MQPDEPDTSETSECLMDRVSDSMMMNASFVYPDNTPTTKEAYY
jgi:hypothetical protein